MARTAIIKDNSIFTVLVNGEYIPVTIKLSEMDEEGRVLITAIPLTDQPFSTVPSSNEDEVCVLPISPNTLLRIIDGGITSVMITHSTSKAIRVMNTHIGVAWIPMNAIHWSVISQEFLLENGYQIRWESGDREL